MTISVVVLTVIVRLVDVAQFQTVPVPLSVIALPDSVSVRAVELLLENAPHETDRELKMICPAVCVQVPDTTAVSFSVQPNADDDPEDVKAFSDLPANVTPLVAAAPVPVIVTAPV